MHTSSSTSSCLAGVASTRSSRAALCSLPQRTGTRTQRRARKIIRCEMEPDMAVSASSSSVAVESSSHSHTLSTPSAAPSAADSAIHSASMGSVVLPDHVAPGGGSGSGSGGRGGRDRWGNGGSGGGGSPSGRNPIAALAAGVGGYFASRAKADPDFWFKILAECGNDAVIIVAVNATARGKRFLQEIEFVLCHLTVSLLCDVALVSMLAPTVARAAPTSALGRLLDGLPANIFEPGSLVAKAGCLLYKGALYAVTGASMGYIGTQIVSLLTDAKEAMDPSYEPPAMVQDATIAAVGWLFFMGISSNIRYQLLAGSEKYLYKAYPGAISKSGSILLRFANNVFGSAQWLRISSAMGVMKPREVLKQQSPQEALAELWQRPRPIVVW